MLQNKILIKKGYFLCICILVLHLTACLNNKEAYEKINYKNVSPEQELTFESISHYPDGNIYIITKGIYSSYQNKIEKRVCERTFLGPRAEKFTREHKTNIPQGWYWEATNQILTGDIQSYAFCGDIKHFFVCLDDNKFIVWYYITIRENEDIYSSKILISKIIVDGYLDRTTGKVIVTNVEHCLGNDEVDIDSEIIDNEHLIMTINIYNPLIGKYPLRISTSDVAYLN